eukprot:TRINITY_DN36400_c0_g1_i1.p1 TRINITY_DN36400_c0_g1~~TRINITY_DN36400_c0_g1_i1.p1  ORF type:complete len:367 (-),score=44.62 TRINITY_DN36400_c0_g1_i1:222-1268(-)
MPGFQQANICEQTVQKCQEVVQKCEDVVMISEEAISALNVTLNEIQSAANYVGYPLRFNSIEEEISLMALMKLLDFGSQYDEFLLERLGRNSEQCVQYGLMGLMIDGKRLDGAYLRTFSYHHLMSSFQLDPHDQETPVGESGAIMLSQPGPIAPYVEAIKNIMVSTGNILGELREASLGTFIVTQINQLKQPRKGADLISAICDSFLGFEDSCIVLEEQISFQRKAVNLVFELMQRFGQEDERFAFQDSHTFIADSGARVIQQLRRLGILELSDSLVNRIDVEKSFLHQDNEEGCLRAAAIAAIEKLKTKFDSSAIISGQHISKFILMSGRRQETTVQLHRCQGTLAY